MSSLTYEIVEGHRKGSKLLWIKEERYLYFMKDKRVDGRTVYLCYQNRFSGNGSCSARCSIDNQGALTTNKINHSCHTDHESTYKDLKTRSAIVDSCIQTATALKDLHIPVPNQQIFTRELAK